MNDDITRRGEKAASVQTAEEFARGLLRHGIFDCGLQDCKVCPEHLKAWVRDIEDDRAAQRQAGREEAREQYKKSVEVDEAYMRTLEKQIDRYAAVVEAAKLAKETLEYVKQYVEGQGLSAEDDCAEAVAAINKAMSDLGKK